MKEKIYLKGSVETATDRLVELAAQKGIVLPHPALGAFFTKLSDIEDANGNGIRLAKKATVEALRTIIGTQINPNHNRDLAFGHTFFAEINDQDEIEIAFLFFKDIFSAEYKQAIALQKEGKLAVSWEIMADLDSQDKLADGTRRINEFAFLGTGLLFDVCPACDTAFVSEFAYLNKKDPELIFAKKITEEKAQEPESLEDFKIFLITSNDDEHWHVAEIDLDGNGETIAIYGGDADPHVHSIVNFQIQMSDNHAHRVRDEIWATLKQNLKAKYNIELKFDPSNLGDTKQGGIKSMNKEQKKIVAELREKFGDLAKDYSDEDLLESTKVAELEQAKKDAEEKSELEKAQVRITELEQEVAELKGTIEAKESEKEEVRDQAEKIGRLKVELANNPYVKEFSNEDYLNEDKIAEAKRKFEMDEKEAELKVREDAITEKESKLVKANKEELVADMDTGHDDNVNSEITVAFKVEEQIKKMREERR